MKLDYLCVGHVCMDMTQSGFVLGGSASYCSLYANSLGYSAGVISSHGEEFEFAHLLEKLDHKQILRAERSTIFENRYVGEKRQQILHTIADKIFLDEHISKENVQILHLCPLADELVLGPNFSSDSFICMTIQGWLRARNPQKEVIYKEMDFEVLRHADVVILSNEDIPDLDDKLEILKEVSKILIITNGSLGAKCYIENDVIFSPSFPAKMIDPTGAGDIFATGFCLDYLESNDIHTAITAGHCLASLCVERSDFKDLPDKNLLNSRISSYGEKLSL